MRQHAVLTTAVVLAVWMPASGQEPRRVPVDGRAMHAQIAGREHLGKSPAVILETGGGGFPFDVWSPIVADIARTAAVVAYDRAGYGGSEDDGESPTPRHNADTLHRLLRQLEVAPPYVLVGHSWGGPLIRMFAALYPNEIAGLIYLDPTDLRTQQQETEFLVATGFSSEGAAKHLESYWRDWANYIATLPAALRTEMQVIEAIERSGAPEFQRLPPVRDVPVSVVLAGRIVPEMWMNRPCEPHACFDRWLEYRQAWLRPLIAAARPGTITVDPVSGHDIPRDNPTIVIAEIRKLLALTNPPAASR